MKIESKEIVIMKYNNGKRDVVIEVGERICMSYENKLVITTVNKIYKNCFIGDKVQYRFDEIFYKEPILFKYESIDKIYS